MAITAQEARVVHVGNGVTTFFSYAPIEGVTADNLKVWLYNPTTGVLTPQTLTTHYTFGSGGVTFLTAPATGVRVILRREVPFIQPDIYTTNTPFPAKVTENRLDQIVMAAQELRDDILTRAIRLPLGEAGFSQNVLPVVENRKGRLLGFNMVGDPVVYDIPNTTTPVTDWAKTWLSTSTSAASGRANLGAAASGAVGVSGLTMNTNRLLGRWSSGTGPIQEVTIGPGLTLSSSGVLDAVSSGATFLALADTPSTYSGAANRAVFVNSNANSLEFVTAADARSRIEFEPAGDARWARLAVSNLFTAPQRIAQELRIDRADFAQEGGRLILRRASDNADAYQLQPFGSGSSPRFRIVKMFGTPAEVFSIEETGAATLAGPLTLPGAPTAASHAATKGYVDSTIDTAVATNVAGASADIATTSGTAFDITGIPSWANQIEVLFFEISLTTTDHFLVQIGTTSGIETAGYVSVGSNPNASNVTNNTGFIVLGGSALALVSGCMFLSRMSNSDVWISTHRMYVSANSQGIGVGSGRKILSGSLDRIRLTRTGAASFDNGSFCVRWRR